MTIQGKSKIYDFKSQEFIGKQGESILDKWLSSAYRILDVSGVNKYQDAGIDRILMRPDGTTVNVEYKFDLASSRTGNLFFETISVDNQNIPGWGWRSQADYWIFLLPTMEVLVVAPGRMRNLVWRSRLEVKDKEVQNVGYKTLGIPIPLSKVREIAYYTVQLDQEIPDLK
ncbi:hypothetical protein [Coleofasciculus sp. H7-2]|uniref:hypothetical protein n=1 Tax=Coleofasciculus sp. H7-2 TaxID=3351545 RepID=UPI0036716C4E